MLKDTERMMHDRGKKVSGLKRKIFRFCSAADSNFLIALLWVCASTVERWCYLRAMNSCKFHVNIWLLPLFCVYYSLLPAVPISAFLSTISCFLSSFKVHLLEFGQLSSVIFACIFTSSSTFAIINLRKNENVVNFDGSCVTYTFTTHNHNIMILTPGNQ